MVKAIPFICEGNSVTRSNNNGRALEARLVDIICQQNSQIVLLGTTQQDQVRDLAYFGALPVYQQQLFSEFSEKYSDELCVQNIATIERLKDSAAVAGDVTDIRIIYTDATIRNISLKHNHDACKHQRPGALISNQLGINNPALDTQYRNELTAIERNFKSFVLPTDRNENGDYLFNLVKARAPHLITNLYEDVCNLVLRYLTNYADAYAIQRYFRFLVGNTNFEKVMLEPSSRTICIKDFSNIQDAHRIDEAYIDPESGYLIVKFDNNFILNMRLHTASSRFNLTSSLSLKFDSSVDMNNAPVPLKIIQF